VPPIAAGLSGRARTNAQRAGKDKLN